MSKHTPGAIAKAEGNTHRCGMCEHTFPQPADNLCPSCDSDEIEAVPAIAKAEGTP